MFLEQIDLTTALRPSLLPDESLLFVQDAVGLYEGKYKIPQFQDGQVYLTSLRACYVGNVEPRANSVAIRLKDVEHCDYYGGLLKSSPKVTLYPKSALGPPSARSDPNGADVSSWRNASSPSSGTATPNVRPASALAREQAPSATWICPICSYSNPIPPGVDVTSANPNMPVPACQACGIKPAWTHLLKAAIAGASTSKQSLSPQREHHASSDTRAGVNAGLVGDVSLRETPQPPPTSVIACPRCTFLNHPSLTNCEMCGDSLRIPRLSDALRDATLSPRAESPGPSLASPTNGPTSNPESIKFSFRAGGDKIFYDRLKGAMVQRKWLLQGAPPIPKPIQSAAIDGQREEAMRSPNRPTTDGASSTRADAVGIAGLEQRGLTLRKNNEAIIGTAFEDLEALMASAKEIVALAESFAGSMDSSSTMSGSSDASKLVSQSANALGLVTTKGMLGSGGGSDALYLSQLARDLAEYLTDDATGVLRREGGIMSLVDLWAVFNRTRGGVELVSPTDFEKAANMWESLKLPLRLRKFRSGVMVVQGKDWSDDKTIASLLGWLQAFHMTAETAEQAWDVAMFGRGVTPRETAERFGWSVGVATEELEMAEENGALCREESVEGVRFWENWLVQDSSKY
ncbi:MAG: hypothetical protein M1817_006173 [Caeruleum heppii]|nr:MAG: hypothetical protein M1817_006173 [Caeruleum heppii]